MSPKKRSPKKKKKTPSKKQQPKQQQHQQQQQQQPKILTTSAPNETDLFETLGHSGYMTEIFPLLEKIMECHRDKIQYRISTTTTTSDDDDTDAVLFESEEDLRQYLCIHGIPNADMLDQDEFETLSLWACYAQVLPSDFTSKYPALTQKDIEKLLQTKLNLVRSSSTSTTFVQGGNARHDKEEWNTLEDVRVFLRGHGLAAMSRSGVRKLSPAEKANIRVWAARSLTPLPQYHHHHHHRENENNGDGRKANKKKNETVRRASTKRSFPFPLWGSSSSSSSQQEQKQDRPSKKKKTHATAVAAAAPPPPPLPDQPSSWFSSLRNMFSSSSK